MKATVKATVAFTRFLPVSDPSNGVGFSVRQPGQRQGILHFKMSSVAPGVFRAEPLVTRTVIRDWNFARAWLRRELAPRSET